VWDASPEEIYFVYVNDSGNVKWVEKPKSKAPCLPRQDPPCHQRNGENGHKKLISVGIFGAYSSMGGLN